MTVLRAANLSFAYGGQSDLFEGISFHLTNGWAGLVGPNGVGKTTLLRLIEGHLQPSGGALSAEPAKARVVRCGQQVDQADDLVEHFATCWTGEALRWMSLLELDSEGFYRWDELSPGVRKRWQIGATLFESPDIVLLDEPTNHLDRSGRELLGEALAQFGGVGLLVSHDRAFLDRICRKILWLDDDGLEVYEGGYSHAREARDEKLARRRAHVEKLQKERRKLRSQQTERRRKAAEAESSRSTRSRTTSIADSDARSMARKERARRAAASLSDAAGATGSQLDRIEFQLEDISYRTGPSGSIGLEQAHRRKVRVCRIETGRIGYGETIVFDALDVSIDRGQRIWLDAPNGTGKTTLIRQVLQHHQLDDDELLYLPQQLEAQQATKLLEETKALPNDELGEVMQRVAALGLEPETLLAAVQPSPGEARKLMLAHALTRDCALVVFDEPTNHLDISSIERLEGLLDGYNGAILLVSHDEAFARAITNERWTILRRRLSREPLTKT